jgi:hypothetical protein
VDSLVVYAFGNRVGAAVQVTPGPMNENLAAVVADLVGRRSVPVYAQWEVAEVVRTAHGLADVVSIEPDLDAAGQRQYLGTVGVAQKAVAAAPQPDGLGRVGEPYHRSTSAPPDLTRTGTKPYHRSTSAPPAPPDRPAPAACRGQPSPHRPSRRGEGR